MIKDIRFGDFVMVALREVMVTLRVCCGVIDNVRANLMRLLENNME